MAHEWFKTFGHFVYDFLQMMYYCEDVSAIACCPSQLEQEFTTWLERISTQLANPQDRIVIVIDGADLITVSKQNYDMYACS